MVIMNEPKHHPDYSNLTDAEVKDWWQPGHTQQIQAVLLSEQRRIITLDKVWIGLECFPAKEIWNGGEGFAIIKSPAGDVYGVESVNTTGYQHNTHNA